jgi:hypothetical protein
MLQRASGNGRELSRDDFYNIMTKKTFWFINHLTNTIFIHLSFIHYFLTFSHFKSVKKDKLL